MQPKRFQKTGPSPRWLPETPEPREPLRRVVDITRLPPQKPGFRAVPGLRTATGRLNAGSSAAAAMANAAADAQDDHGFAVKLFCFYIFMHTGLFGELVSQALHVAIPFVAAMALIITLMGLTRGGLNLFTGAPMARAWLLLTLWFMLTSVFSFYMKASVSYIVPFVIRFMAMPLLFCTFARTPRAVRAAIGAAGLGLIPMLVLCVFKGQMEEGIRFGIPDTTLENPNDLAFNLLWGSTLLLVYFFKPGKLGKLLCLVAIPPSIWFILKTASRSNFISIFVLMAVIFLIVPSKVRITMATVVPVILIVTFTALPSATRQRILAIVISSQADVAATANSAEDDNMKGALSSQAARMELSALAIDATFRHPFFGVGPLMFADETAQYIMERTGKKAPWQTAHDSYLKISSENGIPGALLYIWVMLASLAASYRCYMRSRNKPGMEIANRNSLCILLAMVTYAFGTFFCDIVYLYHLPISIGLTAANYLATINQEKAIERIRLDEALPA